ncbi:hypothetical protein BBJ28_00014409 [Nothophytophthora sp. Chile5]|nr:hypothetical protein BBJ28_00014409 [Nothophytophthora sp. Chile5]
MDASDRGLCALFPARPEYLQVEFTVDEQAQIRAFDRQGTSAFGINLRELLSATFASIVRGPGWARPGSRHHPHVRFWIDNRSAVAWTNKQRSRNPGAQMLLRLQCLLEAKYDFFTSAAHIPGAENIMADAGSRVWQSPSLATTFTNLSCVDANAAQLGAFAVYMWQWGMNHRGRGKTYSTVCAKLSAVRWYHRSNLGYDPGVNAGHALQLKGIRRFTPPALKQQPITVAILRSVRTRLNLSQPRSQLRWGGLLLAYFFLLRRSEYLHLGRRHHAYVLYLGNVSFHDAGGNPCSPRKVKIVGVALHGAKNNQF